MNRNINGCSLGCGIIFLSVVFLVSCHKLPPLTPDVTAPEPEVSEEETTQPLLSELELPDDTTYARDIIDVGISFEKKSAIIECPSKTIEVKISDVRSKNVEIPAEDCKFGDKRYRGEWQFVANESGFAVVNRIPIEDYLKGVVPHEIGKLKQEGIEALKAQAIAARTYAYGHLGSRKSLGFDVYADTRDQVYNGMDDEDSLVNFAIKSTSGLVIKYNGKLIEAFYHSTCGGKTETTEVWGQKERPYLLSTPDSVKGRQWCAVSKYTNWEERFKEAEFNSVVQSNLSNAKADKVFNFNSVKQVFVIERFKSGRIKQAMIATDKGEFIVNGDRIRWLFARNGKILPSALFDINRENGDWIIKGSGSGHGIGMCQMGAIERAKGGQTYEQILKAYYHKVEIVKQ